MMIQRLAVVLSEAAISDLDTIAAYIFESSGSERIATSFVDRMRDRCHSIGNAPRGGRRHDDIVPGLRIVPFEHSAVIAYVVEGDIVHIVNIFYGGAIMKRCYVVEAVNRPNYSAGSAPAAGSPGFPASPGFLRT